MVEYHLRSEMYLEVIRIIFEVVAAYSPDFRLQLRLLVFQKGDARALLLEAEAPMEEGAAHCFHFH